MSAFVVLVLHATPAGGSGYSVRFGPPAVGTGGSNPINIPPSAIDTQLTYVTSGMTEFNLSVTGLYVGKRDKKTWGGSLGLGAGLVIDANGVGPGIYSSFAYDFWCSWVCASFDLMQAVGVTDKGLISPFALRLGISQWF